ncbi:MAG: fused MFS/spermidine synthase [Rickettsiales bacterium]
MAAIYTLTIFTSAFLLFLVQPMISKLLLPHLGGSPAVWNTAMVFFQATLLFGYIYTHLSGKWFGARRQVWIHIALLIISLAWLPISLQTDLGFSSSEHPIGWVLLSLFLSIGIPFFILASNAPLIQFWLANTTHPHAQNPYFLYSASNVGSLLALIAYPFVIEPALTLPNQTLSWSGLFVVFVLLVVVCAFAMRKHYHPLVSSNKGNGAQDASAPSTKMRLYWVALAFFPSSLMLGLTTYITTDIASMPLFWVVPLALYLITFIIAFSRFEWITDYALKAQNILVPMVAFTMVFSMHFVYGNLILHTITFFVITMVCHGLLARNKPNAKHLTEFYVWMSFGGMLGGVFNALIAPEIFKTPIEYTIIFVACLLARPILGNYSNPKRERALDFIIPAGFTALLVLAYFLINQFFIGYSDFLKNPDHKQSLMAEPLVMSNSYFFIIVLLYVFIMVAVDHTYKRPLRLMLIVTSLFLASHISKTIVGNDKSDDVLLIKRNFFGIAKVTKSNDSIYLMHGTTTHGLQSLDPKHKGWLSSYYVVLDPIMKHVDSSLHHHPYAVIGLGTGTSACVGHKEQVVDFYEIDPDMVAIAQDPKLFTYLQDCPTTHNIILGDGRMEIAKAQDKKYGMIAVDAFSSDSIPVHLLTREAIAIYGKKIADNGIIALHISNRHLNLLPITAALAEDAGYNAIVTGDSGTRNELEYSAIWVVLTKDSTYIERAQTKNKSWRPINSDKQIQKVRVWTDNYTNIMDILY